MKFAIIGLLCLILLAAAQDSESQNVEGQIRLPLKKAFFNNSAFNTAAQQEQENPGFLAALKDEEDLDIDTVDDTYYTADVGVGLGNETFSLVLDTATPILWVSAFNLESAQPHHFDCNLTLTCEVTNFLFPLWRQNDSTVHGSVIEDIVILNDTTVRDVKMVLLDQNVSIVQFPTDGILGLGLQKQVADIPIGFKSIVDKLADQNKIQNRSFAIFLANTTMNQSDSENENENQEDQNEPMLDGSDIIFGGWDPAHMDADDFHYYPLAEDDDWQIDIHSIKWGKAPEFNTVRELLFDSRASVISAPKEDFAVLLAAVNVFDPSCDSEDIGDLRFIKCDSCDTLNWPDLTFQFEDDSQEYTIFGPQYIFERNGECIIGIVAGEDHWVVGHQFMKNYYTYFDADNKQIGLAPAAQMTNDNEAP